MVKTANTEQVRALLDGGAQVIEVLPESAWRGEHLPGAVNIPLPSLRADAVADLEPGRPTVVYCYDHECDLSSRGAARLEVLGFTDVYDYPGSKTAWMGEGLPTEGDIGPQDRAAGRMQQPPTCAPDMTVGQIRADLAGADPVLVVLDAERIVLGTLHPAAATLPDDTPLLSAADPGPPSVRPSIPRWELAASMDESGQHFVLVTTSHGKLLGVVRRAALG